MAQWRRNHWRSDTVAHNEECAASCSESNLMGSAGAGSLCAFRFTQTPEQDDRDTEDLHAFAPSPCFGEAQIPSALQPEKAPSPGPKGPSKELIGAVIEMKRRNPRFGCRKIAEQISKAFAIEINIPNQALVLDFDTCAE